LSIFFDFFKGTCFLQPMCCHLSQGITFYFFKSSRFVY
jgi:hypothetical protein